MMYETYANITIKLNFDLLCLVVTVITVRCHLKSTLTVRAVSFLSDLRLLFVLELAVVCAVADGR